MSVSPDIQSPIPLAARVSTIHDHSYNSQLEATNSIVCINLFSFLHSKQEQPTHRG